jgi:hypothetical protein
VPDWYHFSSRHTAVVHFAFGDGSVRGLVMGRSGWKLSGWPPNSSPPTDWYAFQELAGWRDGGTRDTSSLIY